MVYSFYHNCKIVKNIRIYVIQCFNRDAIISALKGKSLKLVDQLKHFGSNISSTERDVSSHLDKEWIAIDPSDKIKRVCSFYFQLCSYVIHNLVIRYLEDVMPLFPDPLWSRGRVLPINDVLVA